MAAGIQVIKFVNGQDADTPTGPQVLAGSTLTFTYEVTTGTGDVPLANVTLTDDTLGPITSFTGDDGNLLLDPGETWIYTQTATAGAGQQTNTAIVTGEDTTNPGTTVTDDNPANYFGDAPAINIVKLVNGQDADTPTGPQVPVGSTLTFTYVVTNPGNVPLSNVVVSDDTLGTITSFIGDNGDNLLDPTETWTYTQTAIAVAGQHTNVGTVTAQDASTGATVSDNNPANYFGPEADLSVLKTVSNPTPNVGDTITYTVTLTDVGPDAATNVLVTDVLPAGLSGIAATVTQGTYSFSTGLWTVGTVSPGSPQTLIITARVASPAALTNTGTITGADQFDPDLTNNAASVTETPQQADLFVSKTVSDPTPNVGDTITFTVTLTDVGPDAAPMCW
jgi:uncharacterized repeat protein (TIGR01451 family)